MDDLEQLMQQYVDHFGVPRFAVSGATPTCWCRRVGGMAREPHEHDPHHCPARPRPPLACWCQVNDDAIERPHRHNPRGLGCPEQRVAWSVRLEGGRPPGGLWVVRDPHGVSVCYRRDPVTATYRAQVHALRSTLR